MNQVSAPRAKKRFGQNFLIDRHVIDQIIKLINPNANDHVLEIGPGAGALTDQLVDSKGLVTVVEIDRGLASALVKSFKGAPNFTLHTRDIMQFDVESLSSYSKSWKVVGNLPYNIATPLIMNLITLQPFWSEMTFMLQKEVALRLTARPGTNSYGRLSIMAQRKARISYKFEVDTASFSPEPKVQSAVVQIRPNIYETEKSIDLCLEKIVRMAFSTRRKTIANSLKNFVPTGVIEELDIDPKNRAENLTISEYERLAHRMLELPPS